MRIKVELIRGQDSMTTRFAPSQKSKVKKNNLDACTFIHLWKIKKCPIKMRSARNTTSLLLAPLFIYGVLTFDF